MKIKILLILVIFLFFQCKPKAQKSNQSSSESKASESLPTDPMAYQIKLTVTTTSSYCGGVRPPDDLIKELNTPIPRQNFSLYIRAGQVNNINQKYIKEVKTDSNGVVLIRLPKGTFSIVSADKKDLNTYKDYTRKFYYPTDVYTAVDSQCYNSYIRTPDIVVNLVSDTTINYNYKLPCGYNAFPCVDYIGQLPK